MSIFWSNPQHKHIGISQNIHLFLLVWQSWGLLNYSRSTYQSPRWVTWHGCCMRVPTWWQENYDTLEKGCFFDWRNSMSHYIMSCISSLTSSLCSLKSSGHQLTLRWINVIMWLWNPAIKLWSMGSDQSKCSTNSTVYVFINITTGLCMTHKGSQSNKKGQLRVWLGKQWHRQDFGFEWPH